MLGVAGKGKEMTFEKAVSLELENEKKFSALPVGMRERVHGYNVARYRRLIRVYWRKLWRNEVIYTSAQPVWNIPLCCGHLRQAALKLSQAAGGIDVEVGERLGYEECRERRDKMLARMLERGGRFAEAAELVKAMEVRGILWVKGLTLADGWKLVKGRDVTKADGAAGDSKKKGKGEGMPKKAKKQAISEIKEIAGVVFHKDALGTLTYDAGEGIKLLMDPPAGLLVPEGRTAEYVWGNKLPGMTPSAVWNSICQHADGNVRMDVAALCEYLAGRDPDMPGLKTKAGPEPWKVGDVWTDPKDGDRYVSMDAVGKQLPCEVCAFGSMRMRKSCPKVAGHPDDRICDMTDVYFVKVDGVAAALAELGAGVNAEEGEVENRDKQESALGVGEHIDDPQEPRTWISEAQKREGSLWLLEDLLALAVWEGNSRKHSEKGLEELTESVRASGVLEPLLARPVGGVWGESAQATKLEVVCGRRRLAAAIRAGTEQVPVLVREMSDRDAAVAVASENMQREDMSPVECGESVWPVVNACGGDVAEAAGLLGKAVAWTRRAWSLRNLAGWWRDVSEGAGLSFAFLAMVARLPEELQVRLGREMGPRLMAGGGDLTTLAAVTSSLLAEIPLCAWMMGDRACGMCTKRSDLQAELFAEMGNGARCLDPVCREEKRLAYVSAQKVKAAQRAGIEVAAVATTEWAKATDSKKKCRVDMVPVVVVKGPESGTVLWRDAERSKREEVRGNKSGGEEGVDATPKGPSPEQRKMAAYVKRTVAEVSAPGRLEAWAHDETDGRSAGAWKVLAACVLFGLPHDDAETAEGAQAVLDRTAAGKDMVWAGRLAEGIKRQLAFVSVKECQGAYEMAQLVRKVFGLDKI